MTDAVRPSILVVEDDAVTRDIVVDVLHECGATVEAVASIQEAKTALNNHARFDVVITDLNLGDGGGLEVARAAAGVVGHVVLISSDGVGLEWQEAEAAGVSVFIPKYELTVERVCELLASLMG